MQHLFVEKAAGGGYCVTSYWVSIKWDTAGTAKSIRTMGSYADTCVKVDGKWLIKDKIIDPWNSSGPNSRDPGIGPCHGCLASPGRIPTAQSCTTASTSISTRIRGARKTIHNQAGPYRKHPLRACPTT